MPAPWGTGTGGSTAIYGAQLERFTPADFEPRANFPDVRDANLPERWPITYDELAPYYRLAEAIYRVRGTQDPLNPDPQASLLPPPSPQRTGSSLQRLVPKARLAPLPIPCGVRLQRRVQGMP